MSYSYSFGETGTDGKFHVKSTSSSGTIIPLGIDSSTQQGFVRMGLGDQPSDWTTNTSTVYIKTKTGESGGSGASMTIAFPTTGNPSVSGSITGGSGYTSNTTLTLDESHSAYTGGMRCTFTLTISSGAITAVAFSNYTAPSSSQMLSTTSGFGLILADPGTSSSSASNIMTVGDTDNAIQFSKTATHTVKTGPNVTVTGLGIYGDSTNKVVLGTNSNPIEYIRAKDIHSTNAASSSDQRIKENIVNSDINACLTSINNLTVRKYDYVDKSSNSGTVHGFIAQEVKTVLPEAVYTTLERLPDGTQVDDFHVLKKDKIFTVLVGAVQKLSQKIDDLTTRVSNLEY